MFFFNEPFLLLCFVNLYQTRHDPCTLCNNLCTYIFYVKKKKRNQKELNNNYSHNIALPEQGVQFFMVDSMRDVTPLFRAYYYIVLSYNFIV